MRGSKASTFQIVCFEMMKLCRTHQPQAPAPLPQKKKEEKEKKSGSAHAFDPFFSLFLSFPPYFNLFVVVVVVCCCFFYLFTLYQASFALKAQSVFL